MTQIKEQRTRVFKTLVKYYEGLKEDTLCQEDYELDDLARRVFDLPPRPSSTAPYIGWLVQTTPLSPKRGFDAVDFANLCRFEASQNLHWFPDGEATKYTKPFEKVGFKGRFPWCAAFVHWCLNRHGIKVPLECKEFPPYTFALVEAWQQYGIKKGWYFDNDGIFTPRIGDLVLFDWQQKDIHSPDTRWEDHIGVWLEALDRSTFLCAEGNTNNKTGLIRRRYLTVKGFVRVPQGTTEL